MVDSGAPRATARRNHDAGGAGLLAHSFVSHHPQPDEREILFRGAERRALGVTGQPPGPMDLL